MNDGCGSNVTHWIYIKETSARILSSLLSSQLLLKQDSNTYKYFPDLCFSNC